MDNQKKRASAEQLEALLLELERRPQLLQVRAHAAAPHLAAPAHLHRHLWRELADRLNALGGVSKTPAKWQQAWRDWKSNTKKKAAKVLEEKAKVCEGGRPPALAPLTELEVRVLELLGTAPDPDHDHTSDLPQIDISSIAELDPLSSEAEAEGGEGERAPPPPPPPRARRRPAQHKHHSSRKAKQHRIELRQKSLSSELSRNETSGLFQRLIYLEESRQSSEQKTGTVLERLARALEDNTAALKQQAAAADNQACALERLTAAVQSRYVYHSGA